MVEMERTITRIHLQPMLFHILIITMHQEMHFLTVVGQLSAIISTYGSRSNYSVFHPLFLKSVQRYYFCLTNDTFTPDKHHIYESQTMSLQTFSDIITNNFHIYFDI